MRPLHTRPELRWTLGSVTASLLVVLVLVLAVGEAAAAAGIRTYRGHFRLDRSVGVVRLDVRFDRSGEPKSVVFQAKDFRTFCDDGAVERETITPLKMRVRAGGRFEYLSYASTLDSQSVVAIRGEIRSRTTAVGRLIFVNDLPEPGRDCGTRGGDDWRARR